MSPPALQSASDPLLNTPPLRNHVSMSSASASSGSSRKRKRAAEEGHGDGEDSDNESASTPQRAAVSVSGSEFSQATRKKVLHVDGKDCWFCGASPAEICHVIGRKDHGVSMSSLVVLGMLTIYYSLKRLSGRTFSVSKNSKITRMPFPSALHATQTSTILSIPALFLFPPTWNILYSLRKKIRSGVKRLRKMVLCQAGLEFHPQRCIETTKRKHFLDMQFLEDIRDIFFEGSSLRGCRTR